MAQQGIAEQNTLNIWKGYRSFEGLWDTELRTPTRLEDQPQATLAPASIVRDGKVVPYADDPDPRRAWALSEVRIARHRVTTVSRAHRGLEAAVDGRARAMGPAGSATSDDWCSMRM